MSILVVRRLLLVILRTIISWQSRCFATILTSCRSKMTQLHRLLQRSPSRSRSHGDTSRGETVRLSQQPAV